jgi:hypothetical protein
MINTSLAPSDNHAELETVNEELKEDQGKRPAIEINQLGPIAENPIANPPNDANKQPLLIENQKQDAGLAAANSKKKKIVAGVACGVVSIIAIAVLWKVLDKK